MIQSFNSICFIFLLFSYITGNIIVKNNIGDNAFKPLLKPFIKCYKHICDLRHEYCDKIILKCASCQNDCSANRMESDHLLKKRCLHLCGWWIYLKNTTFVGEASSQKFKTFTRQDKILEDLHFYFPVTLLTWIVTTVFLLTAVLLMFLLNFWKGKLHCYTPSTGISRNPEYNSQMNPHIPTNTSMPLFSPSLPSTATGIQETLIHGEPSSTDVSSAPQDTRHLINPHRS